MDELMYALAAIGTAGTVGRKLYLAACYGIKRFLEPYFIAHERLKSKLKLNWPYSAMTL